MIVTVRDLLVVSASTPICLSLRQRALLLDLRGDVVGFRLLLILDRAAPDLGETALAVARRGGERKDHFGAVIVGVGGREIRRIEDAKGLAEFDPLTKLHLDLHDAASKRRQHLHQMSGIGLDNPRQHQLLLDVLLHHGFDRELVSERRVRRDRDTIAVAREERLFDVGRTRLGGDPGEVAIHKCAEASQHRDKHDGRSEAPRYGL